MFGFETLLSKALYGSVRKPLIPILCLLGLLLVIAVIMTASELRKEKHRKDE